MEHLALPVHPLTRDAFAPYGDVIETSGARSFLINAGTTRRFHDLALIDTSADGGRPIVSIFRARPVQFPLTINEVERHPLGSQAFVPIGELPFLIVVAEQGADGLPLAPVCFISNGRQGVNYHRGVWHHPLLALTPDSDFLVIDRGGEGNNCDVAKFDCDYAVDARPLY